MARIPDIADEERRQAEADWWEELGRRMILESIRRKKPSPQPDQEAR